MAVLRGLACVVLALAASASRAESKVEVHGSAGVVSNYVFEGVSQSWNGPALQAEIGLEHESGAYAGAFASTVSPRQYPGGSIEIESWVGYEYEWKRDASVSAELAYFAFPGANLSRATCLDAAACAQQSFNTAQARFAARWKWLTLQGSYALTDYFGASAATGFAGSTRGTVRVELAAERALTPDKAWNGVVRAGYTRYASDFVRPVLPGVDGNGPDYQVEVRRRIALSIGKIDLALGIGGTSRGITSRSLTDASQTRLGGPQPYLGLSISF